MKNYEYPVLTETVKDKETCWSREFADESCLRVTVNEPSSSQKGR